MTGAACPSAMRTSTSAFCGRSSTPEQVIGALACAAGLTDTAEPVAAKELVKAFSWEKIPKHELYLPNVFRDIEKNVRMENGEWRITVRVFRSPFLFIGCKRFSWRVIWRPMTAPTG